MITVNLENFANAKHPEKYYFRLVKDKDNQGEGVLKSEKKGLFTWLRAHTFWKDEYKLEKILTALKENGSNLTDDGLRQKIKMRVKPYIIYHPTDTKVKDLIFEALKSTSPMVPNKRTELPPLPPLPPPLPKEIVDQMAEMTNNAKYTLGFLESVEKFAATIPDQLDNKDIPKLLYLDQMLEEISPFVKEYGESVNVLRKKQTDFPDLDLNPFKTEKDKINELNSKLRNTLGTKLRDEHNKKAFSALLVSYNKMASTESGLRPYEKEYVGAFLNFLLRYKDAIGVADIYEHYGVPKNSELISIQQRTGIVNQVNSCWLNACLQSILASPVMVGKMDAITAANVDNSIHGPAAEVFAQVKKLKELMVDGATPDQLGEVAAQLRVALFGGFIQEYNRNNILGFQDPGQFYDVMVDILGFRFPMEITRSQGANARPPEASNELAFLMLTQGNSIQATADALSSGVAGDGGFTYKYKIGAAPQVLVIKTNDPVLAPGQHHTLQESDLNIDLKNLIPNATTSTKYRLVSFAQNRGQAHWVGYGTRDDGWYQFNDASVSKEDSILGQNAHYVVYERVDQ